jgi:hypothetical protein
MGSRGVFVEMVVVGGREERVPAMRRNERGGGRWMGRIDGAWLE